ncbi:hypothetical protein I3F58_27895 [Streptomyces sp. MUM 203J]|uniref:hypothetical protein n=1 Tax=Streptomyces sp. MUM 203J TaxID=2791990 RepID=UPI001F03E886|nr:hypothetical protein [Streptomyces sp. MUM 203J]MCH0543304.1 hypothetical protein [Streptomyces sp. MUM 203J]
MGERSSPRDDEQRERRRERERLERSRGMGGGEPGDDDYWPVRQTTPSQAEGEPTEGYPDPEDQTSST